MIVFIVWCIYCLLEGMRDGWMYNLRDASRFNNFDEHIIFTVQRGLVLLVLAYIWLPILVVGPFAFSFLHNGMYYWSRNALDDRIYKKKWFAQSNTSTAKTTVLFTPAARTIFFVVSIIFTLLWTVYSGY